MQVGDDVRARGGEDAGPAIGAELHCRQVGDRLPRTIGVEVRRGTGSSAACEHLQVTAGRGPGCADGHECRATGVAGDRGLAAARRRCAAARVEQANVGGVVERAGCEVALQVGDDVSGGLVVDAGLAGGIELHHCEHGAGLAGSVGVEVRRPARRGAARQHLQVPGPGCGGGDDGDQCRPIGKPGDLRLRVRGSEVAGVDGGADGGAVGGAQREDFTLVVDVARIGAAHEAARERAHQRTGLGGSEHDALPGQQHRAARYHEIDAVDAEPADVDGVVRVVGDDDVLGYREHRLALDRGDANGGYRRLWRARHAAGAGERAEDAVELRCDVRAHDAVAR